MKKKIILNVIVMASSAALAYASTVYGRLVERERCEENINDLRETNAQLRNELLKFKVDELWNKRK